MRAVTHDCSKYSLLISAYIDGELTREEELELKAHLSQCEECRKTLELMSEIHNTAGDLQASAPADFAASVMRSVTAHEKSQKRFSFANFKFTAIAAAVVLLVLAASRLPAFEPATVEEAADNSVPDVAQEAKTPVTPKRVPSVILPAMDFEESKTDTTADNAASPSTQRSSTEAVKKEDTQAPVEDMSSPENTDMETGSTPSNTSSAPAAGGGSSANSGFEEKSSSTAKPPLPQVPYSQDFAFYILIDSADAVTLFPEYSFEVYQGNYLIILPNSNKASATSALTDNNIMFWEYSGTASAENGLIIICS